MKPNDLIILKQDIKPFDSHLKLFQSLTIALLWKLFAAQRYQIPNSSQLQAEKYKRVHLSSLNSEYERVPKKGIRNQQVIYKNKPNSLTNLESGSASIKTTTWVSSTYHRRDPHTKIENCSARLPNLGMLTTYPRIGHSSAFGNKVRLVSFRQADNRAKRNARNKNDNDSTFSTPRLSVCLFVCFFLELRE